jgi:adenylate kinase family enzyme
VIEVTPPGSIANLRPCRIHVLGGEGTGKTTLAKRLGALIGAPVVNLDSVAWVIVGESEFEVFDPDFQPSAEFVERAREDRLEIVSALAAQPTWITEGKHLGWTEVLLAQADLIIYLDQVPLWRALARILARSGRSAARETRRQRGVKRVFRPRAYARHSIELSRQLYQRVAWRLGDHGPDEGGSRAAMTAALSPYAAKVVHVRKPAELEALVDRLEATMGSPRSAPEPVLSGAENRAFLPLAGNPDVEVG